MMKRLLIGAVGVTLAAAIVSGPAVGRQLLTGDSTSGSGRVLDTDFTGSGRAGPNGENPVGSLTLSGGLSFTASLTCLNVAGNSAVTGYRIETGPDAGEGFVISVVDNGPRGAGRPPDIVVYSGWVPRPLTACPSPGDPPPRGFSAAGLFDPGGDALSSGDLTIVDSRERLSDATPAARIVRMSLGLRPRRLAGFERAIVKVRVRVCGQRGIARLTFVQTTSPAGRNHPVGVRTRWRDELPHEERCETHRVSWRARYAAGRRLRVAVRARTTGRRWSRVATRRVDAYR